MSARYGSGHKGCLHTKTRGQELRLTSTAAASIQTAHTAGRRAKHRLLLLLPSQPARTLPHLNGVWSWLRSLATSSVALLLLLLAAASLASLAGVLPAARRSAITARESPTLAMYSVRPCSSAQQAVVPDSVSSMGAACSWVLTSTSAECRALSGSEASVASPASTVGSCSSRGRRVGAGAGEGGWGDPLWDAHQLNKHTHLLPTLLASLL